MSAKQSKNKVQGNKYMTRQYEYKKTNREEANNHPQHLRPLGRLEGEGVIGAKFVGLRFRRCDEDE